jgi:hypothetical protein
MCGSEIVLCDPELHTSIVPKIKGKKWHLQGSYIYQDALLANPRISGKLNKKKGKTGECFEVVSSNFTNTNQGG